jgi:peptide/nickel transport system substrate-binding protein
MKKVVLFLLVGAMVGLVVAVAQASNIHIGVGAEPRTIMPAVNTGTWESAINGLVFDAIVQGNNQMFPIPGIAESWDYDEDTYTWTFHLRKGVKFHDGTEVTAEDVEFSWRTIIEPAYPGVRFGTFQDVVNAQAYHDGEITDWSQVGVKALDRYTFQVQLTGINAVFLVYTCGYGVMPKHIYGPYLEENGYEKLRGATLDLGYVVGSGPYQLTEWVPDQYIKLEKFPDYWNPRENPIATDGQATVAGIDEVYWYFIPDDDSRFLALKSGQIDCLAPNQDQYWEADADPEIEAMTYPSLVYDYLCFQLDPERLDLFTDVRVRQAIAYATDRDALIDQVLRGLGTKCSGPTHPLRWDFDESIFDEHPDYDIEKTIELMEAAGWTIEKNDDGTIPRGSFWTKDGEVFEFELSTNYPNQRRADICQILQQQYYDAGFRTTIRILDTNAFYYDYLMGGFKYQTAVGGWKVGTDPDATSLWHSSSYPDSFNWLPYFNPELDALIEEGLKHVNYDVRKPIYTEIAKILVQDQPYIWLCYTDGLFAAREDVGLTGFFPSNPNGWYVNIWQWEVGS